MKTCLIICLALLGLIIPANAQTVALPKIVTDGFALYKTDSAAKAVSTWFVGSALTSAGQATLQNYLTTYESSAGKFSGYETAGVVSLTPSAKYYYFVLLYQNAPLYLRFEVYTGGGQQIISNYYAFSDPTQVFPASFFVRSKGN